MAHPTLSSPTEASPVHAPTTHSRGLLLIGIFKLSKSIFFFCVGIGAIHLMHKDVGDVALHLARSLRFDPEGRFVNLILEKADLINPHQLKQIGVATFSYSALALCEGYGLVMERVWAEFLTLGLTIAFLPWELYELARRPTVLHLALLVINLLVLGYLMWLLRRKKQATSNRT